MRCNPRHAACILTSRSGFPASRSKYAWPFSRYSIWNMPLGGQATYVHAGIQAPTTGAHQFRHALATQMLRRGASLTEIGEVLRHRSPQTTTIYAKVDLTALRTLALPWPGGAR